MKTKQSEAKKRSHIHTHTFTERKSKINGHAPRKSVSRALAKLFANEREIEKERQCDLYALR